ncbi:hypothetical protein [Maribacter sp. ACAM166]|uniref:hypothetical protein n=1 Tax=Maribacter sp. ACAM166 TaxID=2508996 RepID=UPI0010FDAB4C|nr:hypothetical protein [Maribacter sp. ACAM166]TLP75707.1 hypothetical protein ES765_14810 [Maribacter sp. ACAM166]
MIQIKTYFKVSVLFLTSLYTQAQCEVFKSEIADVKKYMLQVSQLSDSLRPASEIASFNAKFSTARFSTKTVLLLMGQAVTAADEAVLLASEAQYDSQSCGLVEAMSYSIDAERHAIDARDFSSEAFENVKSASKARNLGNLQFYMRKAQRIIREAINSADASAYAAEIAHYSCSHDEDHASLDK